MGYAGPQKHQVRTVLAVWPVSLERKTREENLCNLEIIFIGGDEDPLNRLDSIFQQSPLLFVVVPRDSALLQLWFTPPREPQNASRAHITHAVNTRIAPWPRCAGRGCELEVYLGAAKQRVPVLEPHRIPLEHNGWTLLILGRVISIEERIPEPLPFGVPSFTLTRCPRLRALQSAPFNAKCDRFAHGSPPLRGRTNADGAASLPLRHLIGYRRGCTCHAPETSALLRKEDARGSKHHVLSS